MDSQKVMKAEYTTYEDLQPFDQDENYSLLIQNTVNGLTKSEEWTVNFNSINDLRRFRKYNKELFFKTFNQIYKNFPKYINSIRSNISKAALILCAEIFSYYEFEYIHNWIEMLLPNVLMRSVYEKFFISDEANKALLNVSENMMYEESLLILVNEIKNNNLKVSEKACETLVKLISNYEIVSLENNYAWENIFLVLIDISRMKKDTYIKKPIRILKAFNNKFENFDSIIQKNLKNENAKIIREIINSIGSLRKDGMNSSLSLKERIIQSKMK